MCVYVYTCTSLYYDLKCKNHIHICACMWQSEVNLKDHSSGAVHLYVLFWGFLICLLFVIVCEAQGPTCLCVLCVLRKWLRSVSAGWGHTLHTDPSPSSTFWPQHAVGWGTFPAVQLCWCSERFRFRRNLDLRLEINTFIYSAKDSLAQKWHTQGSCWAPPALPGVP